MYLPPEHKDKSDIELVAIVLKEPDSFAYLMDRYEKPLRRYIGRLARVSSDEENHLLQDVFIKIYRNLNDFDDNLKFSSWAYRITHNTVIDYTRRAKVRPRRAESERDEDLFENVPADFDLVHEADREYLKKNIASVLETMDSRYRDVIILKYFEEKNYNEISDILKKPLGTVATLLSRAKKQFKEKAKIAGITLYEP